ncbi:MAG: hypothetical protein WC444_04780 [Candidatus Paceibacterota bacterium]
MKTKKTVDLEAVRTAVADYMRSEGCSCCQNREMHKLHEEVLAKLLHVRKYKDGSGYDFGKYESKKE